MKEEVRELSHPHALIFQSAVSCSQTGLTFKRLTSLPWVL